MNFIQESRVGILFCLGLLILGIWLLTKGGGYLVTGGLSLAKHLNIKTMVVGLTIIAFSTSSPELAFNIFAVSGGHGELTLGNIFGSNIANLALVLGIGALIHNKVRRNKGKTTSTPIEKSFLHKEGGWLLGATLGIAILTSLILLYGNTDDSWINFNRTIGFILLVFFGLFFWHVIILQKKKPKASSQSQEQSSDINEYCSLPVAIFLLVAGLLLLVIGGKSAEIGAVAGARILGISEMFIGVTIVAIATSLPEVVTTIIAAKRDQADLVWGNIIGSNIFNILFVLPITLICASYVGVGYIQIPPGNPEPWIYMTIMLGITITTWVMMKQDRDINDKEGYTLIGIYAVFLLGVTIWKSLS